jgi:hypothetical protein
VGKAPSGGLWNGTGCIEVKNPNSISVKLVYQNYNYLSHALIHYYILYLTIVIGLVSNNFSLSITPPYVFDL